MISRSQLNFHESFQPEVNYISKILALAAEGYRGEKDEISTHTGIPTGKQKGKVEPHIKYAYYMGLINDLKPEKSIYTLSLSPVGKKVFSEDKYLHEVLTVWICHIGITSPCSGAPQWSFLVHNSHVGYTKTISPEYLLTRANNFFGVNVSFSELFGVVKSSYREGFFSLLNYLTWDDKILFHEKREICELVFVYAYVIYSRWETLFPDKGEITFLELQENIGFGRTLGFNDDEVNQVLDTLANEGLISLNRQLFPTTLVRTSSIQAIINSLYCRLL